MKTISTFLLLLMVSAACYDDKDPVAEIMTPTGKGYYPVSANTFTDLINAGTISANREYKPNTDIAFELQYWSESAVKEVNLYRTVSGSKEKLYGKAYSEIAAFSKMKSADTVVLMYKTPGVASAVKLDVEIVNENGLVLVRSLTLVVK